MDVAKITLFFSSIGYLMISISFLLGLYLCGQAIWMKFGQIDKSKGTNNPNSALWTFAAGLLLLLSPAFYIMTINTFAPGWDSSVALYDVDLAAIKNISSGDNAMLSFLPVNSVLVLTMFIYSIGLYAYLKGLYLFRFAGTMGQDGRTQGGRAAGHMIGGIAVLNVQWLSCQLLSFFIALSYC
jgi:hypothetical protein